MFFAAPAPSVTTRYLVFLDPFVISNLEAIGGCAISMTPSPINPARRADSSSSGMINLHSHKVYGKPWRRTIVVSPAPGVT